jgi:hypothetical protein
MRLDRSNISCGIYQLDGFNSGDTPELTVKFVTKTLQAKTVMTAADGAKTAAGYTLPVGNGWAIANARPAMVMFNHTEESQRGENLAKYIEAKKLGDITRIPHVNHCLQQSQCTMYVWKLDYKALGIEELLQSYK